MGSLGVEGTRGWMEFGARRALLAGPSLAQHLSPCNSLILLVSQEHHGLEKIQFKEENACYCVTLRKSSDLGADSFSHL